VDFADYIDKGGSTSFEVLFGVDDGIDDIVDLGGEVDLVMDWGSR